MNLAESLLRALADHGAREIFGIPGDFALPLFKVVEESGILPLHTLSHEPGVGFAADAAARLHGTLGVAMVTYGAGALNMVNPVAAAHAEKSPLVVVSGAPGVHERGAGLLLHHQAKTLESQLAVYAEITCEQAVLDDPTRAHADVARVLSACLERSRPVYIEVPRDLVGEPCAAVERLAPAAPDPDALAACADEVLAALAAASAPVLVAGVEICRFGLEAKVAELARRLALPIVTTFMGRGTFAGTGAPVLGTYLGIAGDAALTAAVEDSDAPLLLGVILADTNFGVSRRKLDPRRTIVAADGELVHRFHVYRRMPLGALVDALLERVGNGNGNGNGAGNGVGSAAHVPVRRKPAHAAPSPPPRGLVADGARVTPSDIAAAVNDLMDAHGRMPIAADMGDCLFTALEIDDTELVAPGYYATMGFGVPAGIGVQVATGRRPLVLVGDGAFQMTGWELGNCRRLGLDPVVLVFDNASWEMLRAFQPESAFNDLDGWRFAALADALGGRGHRASTRAELRDALAAAWAERGRFQLVQIHLERGVLSSTLRRFADGIRRLHAAPAR